MIYSFSRKLSENMTFSKKTAVCYYVLITIFGLTNIYWDIVIETIATFLSVKNIHQFSNNFLAVDSCHPI